MFTIHTPQSAPEGSREALAALERNIGFIPNLAGTIAGSPVALAGFVALQTALRGSRLTALEREVVGITVSRLNDAPYSLAAHSVFAAKGGGSPELIAALRAGEPLDDERLESIRRLHRGPHGAERARRRRGARGDRPDRLHDVREPRGECGGDAD